MARGDPNHATKARLVSAASELFAARGFHRTTVRDIAAGAGANLASGNYHYGSKKALYLEVLRAQFNQFRALLAERHLSPSDAELARLSRPQLLSLLRGRLEVMLETVIGPPPSVHSDLMMREMADPSEALPVVVEEFLTPMRRSMERIVMRLQPGLDAVAVERCVFSIVGQVLFYRLMMPALLQMMRRRSYPRDIARTLAAHITALSVGGMEGITAGRGRKRRGG